MLLELNIENIAVIESARASFGAGFNVLSGETGAGKSLLIDSLNTVLGERASRDLIRTGAQRASVSAVFRFPEAASWLFEQGLPAEEDATLVLMRAIFPDGRNVCRINGRQVALSQLKELGQSLVVIHGQEDSRLITDSRAHIGFLDAFAQNAPVLSEYRKAFFACAAAEKELSGALSDESERERKIDLLSFQIKEIEDAAPVDGEEEDLSSRKNILVNSEKLAQHIGAAHSALSEEGGAKDALAGARSQAEQAKRIDSSLSELEQLLNESYYIAEDAAHRIAAYLSALSFDPRELDDIEHRLDTIYKLKKKYGASIAEVLGFAQKARDELDLLADYEARIAQKKEAAQKARETLLKRARALTESRAAAATALCARICAELSELDMPKVSVSLPLFEKKPAENGADAGEFLVSTAPGEVPKPLVKIASGGEKSRIMLALRSVFAEIDTVPTLLFDEIDTGVSGRAGSRIAGRLKALSEKRQIICVTHLAQIAAAADEHLLIEKDVGGESFKTNVTRLDHAGRVSELARIIGGENVTELTLQSAAQMLQTGCARSPLRPDGA